MSRKYNLLLSETTSDYTYVQTHISRQIKDLCSTTANMDAPILLRPVACLVGWTFFMEAWMYKTRIPAFSKPGFKISPELTTADFSAQVPASVRWKGIQLILDSKASTASTVQGTMGLPLRGSDIATADNYNHLHEAPVRFYTIVLALVLLQTSGLAPANVTLEANLAWTYVGLRFMHSLVQAISNTIMVRFAIYLMSEFVMVGLFARLVYLIL